MEKQNWCTTKTPLSEQIKISGLIGPDYELPPDRWYGHHGNKFGLCNRLRAWASIGAAAYVHGFHFATRWESNGSCPSIFYDIFVPDTCAIIDCPQAAQKIENIRMFSGGQCGRTGGWICRKLMHNKRRDEYWDARKHRIRQLRLQPELDEQLAEFLAPIPADTVGVHIRRTDHPVCRRASDERLIRRMEQFIRQNAEQRFLVCADNAGSVRKLQRKFGDRIIWREQKMSADKLRHSSAADAAIDLYALAHMPRILGNVRSSFFVYAALLGGCHRINIR